MKTQSYSIPTSNVDKNLERLGLWPKSTYLGRHCYKDPLLPIAFIIKATAWHCESRHLLLPSTSVQPKKLRLLLILLAVNQINRIIYS